MRGGGTCFDAGLKPLRCRTLLSTSPVASCLLPPPLPQCKPCQEGCSLCQYDAPGVCLPDSCFDGFAYVTALSVCAPCHATCASCHWDPSLPDGTICDDCKSLNAHFSGEDPGVVSVGVE